MITTTSLDLSKQLQEQWPKWNTCLCFAEDNAGIMVIDVESAIVNDYKTTIAPTLDELRLKALELIGPEPEKNTEVQWEWIWKMSHFKDALIQGPDATARFMLEKL